MNKCKCIKKIITTSVQMNTKEEGADVCYFIEDVDFENMEDFILIFAQKLPCGANLGKITLVNKNYKVPVLTKSGNFLRADQIKTRKAYWAVYGNDNTHISLKNCVPNTAYTVVTD